MLTKRDQETVQRELSPAARQWRDIALELGLPRAHVYAIDESQFSVENKMSVMVEEWLEGAGSDGGSFPSWEKVIGALRSCGLSVLANSLEVKYCSASTPNLDCGSGSSIGGESGEAHDRELRLRDLVPIPLRLDQCRKLGIYLRIKESALQRIQSENPDNVNKFKRALFKLWLPDATWSKLLSALGRVDHSLRDRVVEMYDLDKLTVQSRAATATHNRVDHKVTPLSTSVDRPVTAPVKPELKPSTRTRETRNMSPDAQLVRSSSSSYHSASNYDEIEEQSVGTYPSNTELPVPHSLIEVKGKKKSSSSPYQLQSRSSSTGQHIGPVSPGIIDQLAPRSNGSSSPTTTAGYDRTGGGHVSPSYSPVQAREFCDTVTAWNIEAVERILKDGGVDVNMLVSKENGRSALMLAAAADQPGMVRTLLKFKPLVDAKDKSGMTTLFLACSYGNYEVMKLLVKEFADVNSKANDGTPMLLTPAQKGFSMVTQYMLENNANPNIANEEGVTPLMAAARKGQRDVVKVLLENEADVSLVSFETSRTALQEAIENDHQHIVPLLMKATKEAKEKSQRLFDCKSAEDVRSLIQNKNVKVDERRGDQATPLIVQVENGNEEVVRELLVQGANVDLQDKDGESALMKSCAQGHCSIVQLLISHRAILDLKSKVGYTALMYGVKQDDVAIISELLLAGADPTIRNKDSQTVLDMTEGSGRKEMVEEIKKHSAVADSKDPFINLLSGYLEKVQSNPKPVKSTGLELVPSKPPRESQMQVAVVGESEEDSPLREQLSRSWKRIADLETRVHDLTLQTTIEITDDTDLTYYDRTRLETEFRKLREMKHKAEQYAIEAKQTAQRLSAENFKLKEDLSREQHMNELERKNMLREMEAKIGERGGEDEREEAKKEVIQTVCRKAAANEGSTIEVKLIVNHEMIKNMILNQTIGINVSLLVTPGLPFSGKSTVLRKVFNSTVSLKPEEHLSLTEFEGVVLHHDLRKTSYWMAYDKQIELIIAIALLRESNRFLDFDLSTVKTVFGDAQLDQCFLRNFKNIPTHLMDNSDVRWMLTTGDVSFIHAWDVGMNRAVFELLVMMVPECENTILLDFFSLKNDADSIDEIPNLGDACYEGRYSQRNDSEQLLRLQSKLDYLYFPLFVAPRQPSLLVATHSGLSKRDVKQKSKRVFQKVRAQIDLHQNESISVPKLVTVEFHRKADIEVLQSHLHDIITRNPQYHVELPLKWGFLRAFLAYTKKMYISLPELKKVASKLHITDGEVAEFLKVFVRCGSLIHVTGVCPECSDEFVLVRPAEFLKEVEKLYYIQDNDDIDPELKEQAKLGYISKKLVNELWPRTGSIRKGGFFTHTLRRLRILTPVKPPKGAGRENNEIQFFMPRIRPNASLSKPKDGSLFVLHGVVFPFPLQSEFLTYLQQVDPDLIEFDPCDCFNTLRFKSKQGGSHLTLIFMYGYIEFSGTNLSRDLQSTVKTACIEVMAALQRQKPKQSHEYNLAVRCPKAKSAEKSHFINFHPLQHDDTLFCYKCMGMVEIRKSSLEWVQASYAGPASLVKYKEDDLLKSEMVMIAESLSILSFKEFVNVARGLGFSGDEISTRIKRTPMKNLLIEFLLDFTSRTPYDVKRRLGQVLLNNGHWKEALKIYPTALQSCLYNSSHDSAPALTSTTATQLPSSTNDGGGHSFPTSDFTRSEDDRPTHRELRLVAMHMPDWEELGKRLNLDGKVFDQCKKSHRTVCEMAYEMLVTWLDGDTKEKSRNHLITVLKELGYQSAASFLSFGEDDHFWK